MELVEPVQMNIYQSHTYRKDLTWLHFDDKLKVPERQQVKEKQSYISIFAPYLTFPKSPNTKTVFHARLYGRFVEIQSNLQKNQGSNFLGDNFSIRDVIVSIQFRREFRRK